MPMAIRLVLRHFADVQLSGPVWLAELGKPQTVCIYGMRKTSLDVGETVAGVAHRLKWKYGERGDCTVSQ